MAVESKEVTERLRGLITKGSRIVGGAAAGGVGFLAGGPAGAFVMGAAGVMISDALRHVGEEMAARVLGPREEARAGAVMLLTAEKLKQLEGAGRMVREDGFFDRREDGRSDAEEVAETIISKAQREAEERKLPFMANLFANVACTEGLSLAAAHQLVKNAESLTYRQLCILSIAPWAEAYQLRTESYRSQEKFDPELIEVLHETMELARRGFLVSVPQGELGRKSKTLLGLADLDPSTMRLQGLGVRLYDMMELGKIPQDDRFAIAKVFQT